MPMRASTRTSVPSSSLRLYHGSDVTVTHPEVDLNDGFADLGRGFYLTDSHEAARKRAVSRARATAGGSGMVSIFTLDAGRVAWVIAGKGNQHLSANTPQGPFGLCFDESREGIVAWVSYIQACRAGHTEIADLGSPAIVRGWIATEEVEMVCAGLLSAEDLAEVTNAAELTVQYGLTDQELTDQHLTFVGAQRVE